MKSVKGILYHLSLTLPLSLRRGYGRRARGRESNVLSPTGRELERGGQTKFPSSTKVYSHLFLHNHQKNSSAFSENIRSKNPSSSTLEVPKVIRMLMYLKKRPNSLVFCSFVCPNRPA